MNLGFFSNERPVLVDPLFIKKMRVRTLPKPKLPNPMSKYIKEECFYILGNFKGVITVIILLCFFLYYRYKIIQNDKSVNLTNEYTVTYNNNNEYMNGQLIDKQSTIVSNNNKLIPSYMRDKIEDMINRDNDDKYNLRPMRVGHGNFYSPLNV